MKRQTSKCGDWSDDRVKLLKSLWKTPTPSSLIAPMISALPGPRITKDACCGKARRLGLPAKPHASTHPRAHEFRSEAAQRSWAVRYENGTDRGWTWRK